MANLSELAEWTAGIYQLETDDPVQGGSDGIDNLQAKQLANRTAYLKAALEAMNLSAFIRTLLDDANAAAARDTLGAAPLTSPAFVGTPACPTAAAGTNTSQLANTAFVQLTVAALVGSSPEALNTLNELAAALGDDANFAATMTTSLAGKQATHANLTSLAGTTAAIIAKLIELGGTTTVSVAELNFLDGVTSTIQTQLNAKAALDSPALTGTPTAPTAAADTNTTQLATTAFVQTAVAVGVTGRLLRVVVITASGTWNKGPGTKDVDVEVVGGGAPGGGSPATTSTQGTCSGGGGGGGYARRFIKDVVSPQTITIGAAGVPAVGGVGTNGGTSSFGTLLSATGGVAGTTSAAWSGTTYTLGGARGTATGGDINIPGGVGEDGWGSATTVINGMAGKGGDTPLGFGGKGTLNSTGGAAVGYGAGGGGVQNGAGVAAQAGGPATGGIIILREYA